MPDLDGLLDDLLDLLPAQFEIVLVRARAPTEYLSAPSASQAIRANELLRWAGEDDQLLAGVVDAVRRVRQSSGEAAADGAGDAVHFPGQSAGGSREPITGAENPDRAHAQTPVELSPDVIETYGPVFEAAGVVPPVRWTAGELSRYSLDLTPSRLSDLLPALRQAVQAKALLRAVGMAQLELGRLQVIYRREVGAWPEGMSADGLLVEAAQADRSERRRVRASSLGALARFVVGVAAALSVSPQEHAPMVDWIDSLGYQLADAHQYYLDRRYAPAWLLIDMGHEPRPNTAEVSHEEPPPWPIRIAWTYVTLEGGVSSELPGEATAIATKDGLADALRAIFAAVPPAWPLLVDLAMPSRLLDEGIEHWPLFPVGDQWESLSDRYRPRLRWSQRRHDLVLYGRCVDRAVRAEWTTMPKALVDALLLDESRLRTWIQNDAGYAWLIGSQPPVCQSSPLHLLLKEGYGFLIWFPRGGDARHRRAISRVVSRIPAAARRAVIPDELPGLPIKPVIIWDDPRGRGDFELPAPIPAQYIPTPYM